MRAPTPTATTVGDAPSSAAGDVRALLDLVRLPPLMTRTEGIPEVAVGLVDGPVAADHPALSSSAVRTLSGARASCADDDAACLHGTFVAGILAARRGAEVPALCPACTLMVRPVLGSGPAGRPRTTAAELATAILECVSNGAKVVNVSATLAEERTTGHGSITDALDVAARRGVVVVTAAGNDGGVGASALTRHPWVVPVVACGASGRPVVGATLGRSIGLRGLAAPGERVASLVPGGGTVRLGGSSVAAPFVTGTAALLWSSVPDATGAKVRRALAGRRRGSRPGIVPPLLDAWAAYQTLTAEATGGSDGQPTG